MFVLQRLVSILFAVQGKLVEESAAKKSPTEQLVQRVAKVFSWASEASSVYPLHEQPSNLCFVRFMLWFLRLTLFSFSRVKVYTPSAVAIAAVMATVPWGWGKAVGIIWFKNALVSARFACHLGQNEV